MPGVRGNAQWLKQELVVHYPLTLVYLWRQNHPHMRYLTLRQKPYPQDHAKRLVTLEPLKFMYYKVDSGTRRYNLIERLHRRVIFNMFPERRLRKLLSVNTFKGKTNTDGRKENSSPLNNAKGLTFKPRNYEFTDANSEDALEAEAKEESETRKILDPEGSPKNTKNLVQNRDVIRNGTRKTINPGSRAQCSNAETKMGDPISAEIHRSVKGSDGSDEDVVPASPGVRKDSNDFSHNLLSVPSISTSNLLEEIEDGLPSPYSLVNVLDHTPHTVTNVRTFARLSRVGKNLIQNEEEVKQVQNVKEDSASRINHLQTEAYIQKTLIDQVDKVIQLCKDGQKDILCDYEETLRILLISKLRYEAINVELQNIKLSGGEAKENNVGEVVITDLDFKLNDSRILERGPFVCVTFQKEHLFASQIQDKIIDDRLHFPVNFEFTDLNQNFTIYLELYQLNSSVKPKKETSKVSELKILMKIKQKTNKNVCGKCEEPDFVRVGTASFRLGDVRIRQNGKINLNLNKVSRSEFEKTVSINLGTRIFLNTEFSGFLNLFKNTCWHRLWCCLAGRSLQFWNYPEDKDYKKEPFESIDLLRCKEVKPVSMDVCIRPHTFAVSPKGRNPRFLLSASSNRDMANWINRLKSVIHCLELWNPDF